MCCCLVSISSLYSWKWPVFFSSRCIRCGSNQKRLFNLVCSLTSCTIQIEPPDINNNLFEMIQCFADAMGILLSISPFSIGYTHTLSLSVSIFFFMSNSHLFLILPFANYKICNWMHEKKMRSKFKRSISIFFSLFSISFFLTSFIKSFGHILLPGTEQKKTKTNVITKA